MRANIADSTVYDADHLLAFAYHHIGSNEQQVTPSRLAAAVELIYREDGFLLAEVQVVPSADGRSFELRVHEGQIEHISIEGVDDRMHRRIRETVEPLLHLRPLTRKQFERALALVDDIAGLRVTSEIDYPRPGGGARLRIIATTIRGAGSATIDNPPRQLGRSLSAHVEQSFFSVISTGDVLRLYAGGTLHFNNDAGGKEFYGLASYRTRITREGTYLEAIAGNVEAKRDASGKFVSTDLEGKIFGASLGHPFLRDFHRYGYGLLEFRHSGAQTRGGGFSFESAANVGAVALLYGHVFNGGGRLEGGLTVSGGQRDGTAPAGTDDGDNSFWHVRGGCGFVAPITIAGQAFAVRGEALAS